MIFLNKQFINATRISATFCLQAKIFEGGIYLYEELMGRKNGMVFNVNELSSVHRLDLNASVPT